MKLYLFPVLLACVLLFEWGHTQVIMNHSFKTLVPELQRETIFPVNPFQALEIIDTLHHSMRADNKFTEKWLGRKLFNEHLLDVQKDDYRFVINPLANLRLGNENNTDALLWQNTRAIQAYAKLGKNFIFYTDFYENQALFPQYIRQKGEMSKEGYILPILPGTGIAKRFGEDRLAHDFAYANGYLSLQANKYINLQFGTGKHFFGHGYRSLFLSDYAFNYPYLRMTTKFWKIHYTNLFTQMTDIRRTIPENETFAKKYVTSHYLTIKPNDKIEFGLFETIVYQDSMSTRGLEIAYLNPFILYRPVEFALGSRGGNALLGAHMAIFPTKNITLYGQLLLDELKVDEVIGRTGWWANKYSIQAGFKSYNTFVPNLFVQAEINYSRPYTYTHQSDSQNYGHYNEPLAHPLGANFVESVSNIRYRYKRWIAETQLMYAIQGRDFEETNWGSDIYQSYNTREQDFDNRPLQGNRTKTLFSDTKLAYILNPGTNLRLEVGYTFRQVTPEVETTILTANTTHWFHLGFVTRLNNQYHDF